MEIIKTIIFFFLKLSKRFIISILKLCVIIILSPILYFNRIIPLKYRFTFGEFYSQRIGQFACAFYVRYAENYLKLSNPKCIYYLPKITSNDFLRELVVRNLNVFSWVKVLIYVSKKMPYLDCLVDNSVFYNGRDSKGLTRLTPKPKFKTSEVEFCHKWLRSNGWKGIGQPIICLHVRDSGYLEEYGGFNDNDISFWNYHSYRDSEIIDYKKAVEWLLSEPQSAFVVRAGKSANQRLNISSDQLVDYPFSKDKNDLIDIWLFSNSDMVISTGSGPDVISSIFQVPTIYLNHLVLSDSYSWSKSLWSSKHLYWIHSGKHLTFEEYALANYHKTKDYFNYGIEIKNLTPDEILNIVKDGWTYFIDNKPIKDDDIAVTDRVRGIFKNNKIIQSDNQWINPEWVISSSWIPD